MFNDYYALPNWEIFLYVYYRYKINIFSLYHIMLTDLKYYVYEVIIL